MDHEDKKLLRTWEEIAEKVSTERDSKRLRELAEELTKALEDFVKARKIA